MKKLMLLVLLVAAMVFMVAGPSALAEESAKEGTKKLVPNTIVPLPCEWQGEWKGQFKDGDAVVLEMERCPRRAPVKPVFIEDPLPPPAPAPERRLPEWLKLATWAAVGAVGAGAAGYVVGQNLGPEYKHKWDDGSWTRDPPRGPAGAGFGAILGAILGAGAYVLTR